MPTVATPLGRDVRVSGARSPGAITRRQQVRHGLRDDGQTLDVGTRAIDLANVSKYSASGLSSKDLSTGFATIAIFSGVAALYVFGVLELGWRARMMYEGVLFGLIAICAVAELFSARRDTLYTFKLSVPNEDDAVFVTADKSEALRLKAALVAKTDDLTQL